MREVLVALEFFCILVTAVVLYGNIFEVNTDRKRNRSYTVCAFFVMVALFFNLVAWAFDGRADLGQFLFAMHAMCFVLDTVISVYFMFYLWNLICEIHPLPLWTMVAVESLSGPFIVLVLVLCAMGKIFRIQDGYYVTGALYPVSQVYFYFCMVWALLLILSNMNHLGLRSTFACLSYITMPTISLVVQIFYPEATLTYVAFTYSILLIYIMIQAEYEREYKTRETSLIEASTRDSLTGIYNRRAYDMACAQMKKIDDVGIFFCDANGLKRTNDEFGHEAGDRLLLTLANGLIDIFSRNQVFRISGDEFVIMCPNMPYEMFHAQGISLRAFIRRNGMPIASMGEAYGRGVDVYQLIKQAEHRMYQDKEQFYAQYPQMERRNR